MKKPCGNCPFLKKVGVVVSKEKAAEIVAYITNDGIFHCHKTLNYSDGEPEVTPDTVGCFGSALFLENIDRSGGGCMANYKYRLAIALEQFDLTDLRQDDTVYQSADDFIESSL